MMTLMPDPRTMPDDGPQAAEPAAGVSGHDGPDAASQPGSAGPELAGLPDDGEDDLQMRRQGYERA